MATAMLSGVSSSQPLPAWRGWLPLAILPTLVLVLAEGAWPRWALMWVLIIALYAGWKWVTWRRTPASHVPAWRHAAYLTLWPGLDAPAFLGVRARPGPSRPALSEWLLAAAKLLAGIVLLWGIAPLISLRHELLLGWIGMTGIVFVLHFGSVHLLSCLWRTLGIDARPLMDWPIAAASLGDFWGRRWNTAFRDLAHRFFFVPALKRWGAVPAVAAAFMFSGLIHDLAISVPAGGGYGWPTLYFLLQGGAVLFERSPLGKRLGLGRGWRGWLFTMLVVLVPAYVLFHPPFLHEVVIPFLQAIGAAPAA